MGGIRNGNLQEQQWHLVCNDPLSGPVSYTHLTLPTN